MVSPRFPNHPRRGLTLLEVLVALGIFLLSLVGIIKLVSMGADQAREVQLQAQATQLCQAKLAEVVAGVVPLSGQSDVPFDEDPSWLWSLDASPGDIAGLWKITVRVSRQRSDGSRTECSLERILLDPSLRGSTLDASALAVNSSSSNASNSQGATGASGTPAGTSSGSSSTPAGAKATMGGGTAPASASGAAPGQPAPSSPAPSSAGGKGTKGGS